MSEQVAEEPQEPSEEQVEGAEEADETVEEEASEDEIEDPEPDVEELISEMAEEAENFDYGTVEDLYRGSSEPADVDQYFDREPGLEASGEGLEGYLALEDSETLLIGNKTAQDLDSSLEAIDEALEGEEESKGVWDKIKDYASILKPEDKWDWTMYGGATVGLGGLFLGSSLALGTGLLIEGIGAGANLYKNRKETREETPDQEPDYELGALGEISDYEIKVVDEELYPEELQ